MQKTGSPEELIESRRDYSAGTLRRQELDSNPLLMFSRWLQNARDYKLIDATAMALSTADSSGQPHSRIVLLKQFDAAGFVWFTYQKSNKGNELRDNPKASILFYWRELERQVRIEGEVARLNPSEADEYFHSRPEGSRFSAAASEQSSPVVNRQILEDEVSRLHQQHPDGNVPRPDAWGGYQLTPARFEFWQGRNDRLHDRFVFSKNREADDWQIQRLSP